ncbi:DNA mismatch repair protein mutL [sediment metagenome]|uniref:DNA mismatch repair protein mutL n=1 Tax=sediment metagenome TaxID=749907 RepID=D9PI85_9ZZZZ
MTRMAEGGHIRLLPSDVANKIAAGEVVERPASILKEFLENAIDAGATQIDVDAVSGGVRLISVSDNGSGMNRDDAVLSIERHATSKIRTAEDIEHIHTLGFRGEALAAISSVSRFRLRTRRHDELAGAEVTVSGGTLQDVRETGTPPGTILEVRDLFFNMPARRKFLRSPQTETSHLRQMFVVHALAWPEIGMKLSVDGRPLAVLAGGSTLGERIHDLMGPEVRAALQPVDYRSPEVGVTGFVGLPSLSRGDRSEQHVFVNRRAASAPVVNHAIAEAYRTLLPEGRFPYVYLMLELECGLVDVNVHPTKRDVRFRHPSEVRDALIAAIRRALGAGSTGFVPGPAVPAHTPRGPDRRPVLSIADLPQLRAFPYPQIPAVAGPSTPGAGAPRVFPNAASDTPPVGAAPPESLSAGRGPWQWCRVVGQVGGLYVILETDDGFVIMDPHAAHERVLFERFMTAVRKHAVDSQGLLVPETVELPPRDAQQVRRHLEAIRHIGFGVSEFGGDTFVVDALPSSLGPVAVREWLIDVAQHLETLGDRATNERLREEAIAQAACKAAVKARDHLTLADLEQLVMALAATEMPYTCPHGRPTLIHTSFAELERKFGRA